MVFPASPSCGNKSSAWCGPAAACGGGAPVGPSVMPPRPRRIPPRRIPPCRSASRGLLADRRIVS
ncbi:hypothetical protein Ae505Ps2_4767c [Pseudonocardia sp. Ae505_Ps2]|nr:hypothetical protein Ae505Ps2_4767c [Pseudonocardia sp. Ae505_Ps2]